MEYPIQIIPRNAKPLAVGVAQNLLFRFGLKKTVESEKQDTRKPGIPEGLEGVPLLTSLAIRHKSIGNSYFVFEECIMTINLETNIVSTPLQGRNGTIKEYVTQGDYSITVAAGISDYRNGDLTEAYTEYPAKKITELKKYLDLSDALEVQSDFLEYFGIKSAVVKNFSLTQETHSNRQAISITMLSDTPYEIKLKQEQDVKASK